MIYAINKLSLMTHKNLTLFLSRKAWELHLEPAGRKQETWPNFFVCRAPSYFSVKGPIRAPSYFSVKGPIRAPSYFSVKGPIRVPSYFSVKGPIRVPSYFSVKGPIRAPSYFSVKGPIRVPSYFSGKRCLTFRAKVLCQKVILINE